jgi:phage FluMu gp28-like protein
MGSHQGRLIFDHVERLQLNSRRTRKNVRTVRTPYPRLTYKNSLIMARTADEDGRNLRGHSADRVIVDEAAYVRDSVIQEVIRPMLADRDGQLVMVSTPFGKNHFYRAFVRGLKEGNDRFASFTFPSVANPHINRAYVEEQRAELTPRQFAVEYEARFLDDQNSVFTWEDIHAAIATDEIGVTRESEAVVAGIDWARYSDYTAMVAVSAGGGTYSVVGIDRLNNMDWRSQVRRVIDFLRIHRVSAVLTDQTSIGDPLLEMLKDAVQEAGLDVAVDGLTFTGQSKRELVDDLALRFAHGAVTIPHDDRLVRELQHFEYEVTEAGNVRLSAGRGFHDDLVMALALACRAARPMGASGRVLALRGSVAASSW